MLRSEDILKAIGESYFLLQSQNRISDSIPSILGLLGKAAKVDRVYIFRNYIGENNRVFCSQKFEWAAEGVSPQIDYEELQNLSWSDLPIVYNKLNNNTVINEVLDEESNGVEFYDIMSEQGILSFLFIPIIVEEHFWGFIGFDNCSSSGVFKDEQVAALQAFTSTLGFTILSKRQKKRLLKAKKNYFSLINSVNEVIFKLDKDSQWVFVNRKWRSLTGIAAKSIIGTNFHDAFKKNHRKLICRLIHEILTGALKNTKFEAELNLNNGESKWVKVEVSHQMESSNLNISIAGSIIDISNEREVLTQLEESIDQTNAIINSVKDTLYTLSGDLKKVFFVSDNLEVLGVDKKKYIEKEYYWLEIVHFEDKHIVQEELKNLQKNGVFEAIYRIVNDYGKEVWIQDKAWAVKDKKDEILRIHGRYSDISELKSKELKLKSSEESLQKLNDLLQVINDTQLSFNLDKDFQSSLYPLLNKTLEITGSKFGFIGEVLYDEDRKPYMKTHSITNIDWSKESNQFFQENFKEGLEFRNLNTLFGRSLITGELLISNDVINDPRSGGIPEGHPIIKKYMGVPIYKGDEFLGLMGFANKNLDYNESDVEILQPLISGYANLIKSIRTNRLKKQEEKLRLQSERMYNLLSENTTDIIALHSLDLKFEYVSPSIYKILGYTPEECLGKTPSELFGIRDINYELKNNLEVYSIVNTPINKLTGRPVSLETLFTPVKNDQGEVYSYIATTRDVTDREAVLNELKESLFREQELNQLKSRFISMTSHEFRTPLATILSSTEILEMILDDFFDEKSRKKVATHLDRINNQIQRLTDVISDLLILEKNAQDKIIVSKENISIHHFLKNIVDSQFPDSSRKIKLNLPKEDKIISLDPSIFSHILNNLVDNAIKYSKKSKEIPEVTLEYFDDFFQINVNDNGLGIPIEDQKYIFGSFFRAKNVNNIKGTGLGLNIVKEFVEKLGGQIYFESVENEGTEFILTFPYE